MILGVDLSSIQQTVDYSWLVKGGFEFVIIRCGIGSNQQDPNYNANLVAAQAAGLKTMAYHVFYPLPNDNPETIAQWHFTLAKGQRAAADVEFPYPQSWVSRGCTDAQVRVFTNRYLAEYSRLDGRPMVLYSYPDFLNSCCFSPDDEAVSHPLWIASYTQAPIIPKPWTDYAIWQNAGGTKLRLPNGIAIDTDEAKDLTLFGG